MQKPKKAEYTTIEFMYQCRRTFRIQTSDNMDGWKSTGGKSQRRKERKKRRSEYRKSQKEDAGARKGIKVA